MSSIVESYLHELNDKPVYVKGMQKNPIKIGPHTFKLYINSTNPFAQDDTPKPGEVRQALRQIIKGYNGYYKGALKHIQSMTGHKGDNKPADKVEGFRSITPDVILVDVRGLRPSFEIYWKLKPPVTVYEYKYDGTLFKKRKEDGIMRAKNGDYYL